MTLVFQMARLSWETSSRSTQNCLTTGLVEKSQSALIPHTRNINPHHYWVTGTLQGCNGERMTSFCTLDFKRVCVCVWDLMRCQGSHRKRSSVEEHTPSTVLKILMAEIAALSVSKNNFNLTWLLVIMVVKYHNVITFFFNQTSFIWGKVPSLSLWWRLQFQPPTQPFLTLARKLKCLHQYQHLIQPTWH